jgi:hypothetical protein
MLLIVVISIAWLALAISHGRLAVWLLLLWIPVQGWIQLNVFADSSATVLIYEFVIICIYVVFGVRAVKLPGRLGPPQGIVKYAAPFAVWILLLIPMSISPNGLLLTLVGVRTYLLPLPLIWIGYRAFESRRELESVGWLLMVQTALIAIVAVSQLALLSSLRGTVFEVPLGFGQAGVIRPPGTFSSAGHYGMYILFAIPLAMGMLSLSATMWKRIGFAVGLVGGIIGLMANTQRATIILLALGLPMIAVLTRRRQAMVRIAVGFAVVVCALVIGNQFAGQVFQERIESIGNDLNTTMVVNPTARLLDSLRTPVWGAGLGVASPGSGRLMPETSMAAPRRTQESIKPSESFMAALIYDTGVPGLALFYLLLVVVLGRGLNVVRACRGTDLGTLASAIVVFQFAILLQSWAYDPLHYPPSRVLFWFWGGVLLALPRFAHAPVFQPRLRPVNAVPVRRLTRPAAVMMGRRVAGSMGPHRAANAPR